MQQEIIQQEEKQHGGARKNSGRKPMSIELRLARDAERRKNMLDELLFPAFVQAFNCEPNEYGERYLEVEISKCHIEIAYGKEGLSEWMSFFTVKQIGYKMANGKGTPTCWSLNLAKYGFILKLIQHLGHDVKNLPEVWFPPHAMMQRVDATLEKKKARKMKKMGVIWDDTEARLAAVEAAEARRALA